MSFMEGFADAISTNIEDKRKRRRDQEDDMFETNYKVYLSRQEEQRKKSENEKKVYGRAQFLANRYGLGDQGAKVFFQYFNGGGEEKDLAEMMKNGTISFGDTPQPKAPMGNIAQPSTPNTDQEMKQSGLDPETVDTQEDSYVPKLETGRSPLAVNNMKPEQAKMTAAQEKTVMKIAQSTGREESEVRETLYGQTDQDLSPMLRFQFKSNNNQEVEFLTKLPDDPKQLAVIRSKYEVLGKTKEANLIDGVLKSMNSDKNIPDAEGFLVYKDDKSGKMIRAQGKTINGQFFKFKGNGEYEEQGEPLGKFNGQMIAADDNLDIKDMDKIISTVDPYVKKRDAFVNKLDSASEAADIIVRNPNAATETAQFMSKMQGFQQEISAIGQVLESIPDGDKSVNEKAIGPLQSLIGKYAKVVDESEVSVDAKRLMKLQMDMAYSQLKIYGETGSGISNKDLANQIFLVFDKRPGSFESYLKKSIRADVQNLESQRLSLLDNAGPMILQSRTHGWLNDSVQQQVINAAGDYREGRFKNMLAVTNNLGDSSYTPGKTQNNQGENKPVQNSAPVQVMSKQEYDNLQSGQEYIDPKGVKRRKQ